MAGAPDRRRLHPAMRLVALQGALVVVLLLGELAARWFAAPPAALVRLPDPELWVATADDEPLSPEELPDLLADPVASPRVLIRRVAVAHSEIPLRFIEPLLARSGLG